MDQTTKTMARSIIESAARHILSAVAVWLVGHQLLSSSAQTDFVQMGVGLVLAAAAAGWSWWDKSGRQALAEDLTNARTLLARHAAAARTQMSGPTTPPSPPKAA